jgi:hypothetical protein
MRLKSLLLTSVLAGLLAGCVVHARPAYVETAPPQPQYEEVYARPGYVWVRGHWEWDRGRWRWERGHWESERRGHVWRDGYWQNRGGRYYWVEGTWQEGTRPPDGGVIIRDHRQSPPPGTIIIPSQER